MKKIGIVLALVLTSSISFAQSSGKTQSAGNFTIGLGPIGNFYLTDRRPEMSPGIGALVYFDYRWSPELSTTATVTMLTQDGKDRDNGQNNIIFMGIPTFDIKYYFITNPSRWDPFALVGVGYYVVTHGSQGRGLASGLGAQIGGGADYFLTSRLSLGLTAAFRSIGLLGNGSTGNFPLSLDGRLGFHF